MNRRAVIGSVVVAATLVATACAIYRARVGFIRSMFTRGTERAPPPVLASAELPDGSPPGLGRVDRVRVILIDGVDQRTADTLPNYRALCDSGIALTIDSGFPSVSLPIQRVLWTGLTQRQTGIWFSNTQRDPPALGIPAQVPDSVAVAESHLKIIHSLGFARPTPSDPKAKPPGWSLNLDWRAWFTPGKGTGFADAAIAAVRSDARLAFVHILRTDSIAHKRGRASAEFRATATWADNLLGRLLDAGRQAHPRGTRWFVLADHGHRAGGGHGGAEPWIRQVRGCIAGQVPAPPDGAGSYVHMVDYSRAIADSLGVALSEDSAGRPLWAALLAPVDETATLPRPSTGRWLLVAVVLLLAAIGSGWVARGVWWQLPWWWPAAYLSVVVLELTPSMSTHMIYRADGRIIYMAAIPGLCVLALAAGLGVRRVAAWRIAVTQLLLPAAIAACALILCGGAARVIGISDEPPLMPRWTGHASVFLVLVAIGALVVALAALASAVLSGSGRTRPSETGSRSA